jgi:hypothetical protein
VQLVGWQFEEWKSTAGLEMNSDDGILLRRIDHKEAGMRTAQNRAWKALALVQIVAIINPRFIFIQVDD